VTFTVTSQRGQRASATLFVRVGSAPAVATSALPTGEVGVPYAARLLASGGTPPYRWSVAPGHALPGGLTLTSGGTLAGNPATPVTMAVTLAVTDALGGTSTRSFPVVISPPPPAPERYATLSWRGRLFSFGSTSGASRLPAALAPYVGAAAEPAGPGYWVLAADGRVRGLDGARSLGSVGRGVHPSRLVGIAADPAGTGYWVASASGQVYGFGSAHAVAAGPTNAVRGPVVAIAADPHGAGYWLLEASGRIDAYGAARPMGSVPAALHVHAAALAPALSGLGYTVLSRGGRLFGFGVAAHAPGRPARYPSGDYVGIATAPVGIGGWVVSADGLVRAYGSARLLPGPAGRLGSAAVSLVSGT
jgi:hypothetical protein